MRERRSRIMLRSIRATATTAREARADERRGLGRYRGHGAFPMKARGRPTGAASLSMTELLAPRSVGCRFDRLAHLDDSALEADARYVDGAKLVRVDAAVGSIAGHIDDREIQAP